MQQRTMMPPFIERTDGESPSSGDGIMDRRRTSVMILHSLSGFYPFALVHAKARR